MLIFKYCECGCRGHSSMDIGNTSYWIYQYKDKVFLHRGHAALSPLLRECSKYEEAVQYATEDARHYLEIEQKKLDEIRRQILG